MAKSKFRNKEKSIITKALENKKSKIDIPTDNFRVSFQYLDTSQKYSSTFKDWQKDGLLSKAMETIQGYCNRPLREQIDGVKFTRYGDFPPKDKTKFIKPAHVPTDAEWARIHINGKAVIIGHLLDNTFYLVYFDKSHKFWLTKRETGK